MAGVLGSPVGGTPVLGFLPVVAPPVLAPILPAVGAGGLALGLGIVGALKLIPAGLTGLKQIWDYLNQRGGLETLPTGDGDKVFETSGQCTITTRIFKGALSTRDCTTGLPYSSDPSVSDTSTYRHTGRGWRFQNLGPANRSIVCEPAGETPPSLARVFALMPDLTTEVARATSIGGTFARPWFGGPVSEGIAVVAMSFNGQPIELPGALKNPTVVPPLVTPAPPDRKEEPMAPPVPLPRPAPLPTPAPDPEPVPPGREPEPLPPGDPAQPGKVPTAPPITTPRPSPGVPGTAPGTAPKPGEPALAPDGTVLPLPKPVVTPTPTGQIDYGTGPIGNTANQPRPDLVSIATELGRQEEKMAKILTAPGPGIGILDALEAILTFLASLSDGAPAQTWILAEGCPAVPGVEPESRTVEIPETSDNQASMLARFDALAELIQHHKDLRGPICRGRRPEGVGVTVNFRSLGPDGASGRVLRKELSYRDPGGGSLASHTSHWHGFQWDAGPVVVSHDESRMGSVKVWASDDVEGMRVIRHIASIAGVNPDTEGIWSVTVVNDSRLGRTGTMAPQELKDGGIAVTVRPGSSGPPMVLAPG